MSKTLVRPFSFIIPTPTLLRQGGYIRRAQLREEEILRDADKKAERVLERAEEQIELEKKRMVNEVKDEVSKMALEIASAVIERDVSETEHKDLIDSFIDKMG